MMSEVISEARKQPTAGREVVPCEPGTKKPIGDDSAQMWDRESLIAHLKQNPCCNIGLVLGPVTDFEGHKLPEEKKDKALNANPRRLCLDRQ